MAVLYLTEQGATLRKESERLVVTKEGQVVAEVPAFQVEQVIIFGQIQLTTAAVVFMLLRGIDVVFLSQEGRYYGRLVSTESAFGELRHRQHHALSDEGQRLSIARSIVGGKLANLRSLLGRAEEPGLVGAAVAGLGEALAKVGTAAQIGSLQGLEGKATALYFAAFKRLLRQHLGFTVRVRRPPTDPVNSLLSLGYTLLVHQMQAAVHTVGLDPYLGFLHATVYSRPALVLDLIEEFRAPVVDALVLRLVNEGILTGEDFYVGEGLGPPVLLKDEARRLFLRQYEEHVQSKVLHPPTGHQVSYRRCFELQARQMARVVLGEASQYQPFTQG